MPKTVVSKFGRKIKNGQCIDVEGYPDISDLLSSKTEFLTYNSRRILDIFR